MLFLSVLSHLPRRQCAGHGSAVSRLTFAADAGGQPGLVLSAVAGIAPVLMDQMGAGARSRPVRRRPELTGEARRQFAPRPVHHRRTACCAPWRTSARRGCSARRADRHMAGAPVQSSQAPGCAAAGRQLMALPAHSGIGPPERTRLRLACSRTALRAAWRRYRMRNPCCLLKVITIVVRPVPGCARSPNIRG